MGGGGQYSGHNTPLGHHTDSSLGQYNSLGEYCGLHTTSSVFLISIGYSTTLKDIEKDRNIFLYVLQYFVEKFRGPDKMETTLF